MNVNLLSRDDDPGTEKAYKFFRPEKKTEVVWVPRSLVNHVSKNMPDLEGFRLCRVDVQDWFADKNNL